SEAGGDVCPFLEIGSLEGGGPVLAAASGVANGVSQASKIPLAERQPSDRQRALSA
ncbi:MAG: inositol monophosphatase, partial [Rhizobium oryzihabitans]